MPLTEQEAVEIVYAGLATLNEVRKADSLGPLALSLETKLLGSGGELDSLQFINLIIEIEQQVAQRVEQPIAVVGDSGLADPHFQDVGALARFLVELTRATEA
jgi:acyl carrier protein